MALLAKKLSFLPFMGVRTASPFMATYVSTSRAALRRNNANQTTIEEVDVESATDEDEVMDQQTIMTDTSDVDYPPSVPCRVMTPTRRPWATSQDESAVRFRMDMPGVSKEDVKVYLDNGKLVVRGRYTQVKVDVLDEDNVLADNVGVYTAEVMLPENVQREKIKSEMKDGMLLVTAPKEVTLIAVD